MEGLPPGRSRISSPYDLDARWGVRRDTFWKGCKVHVTETCGTGARDDGTGSESHGDHGEAAPPPHLIAGHPRCWPMPHRRPGQVLGLNAQPLPSTSAPGRPHARKAIPAAPGTLSPSAAPTRS